MRNILLAASILSITITGAGNAQGTASSTKKKSSLTNAQIRQMARVAHTPEQYRTVAGNYAGLQEKYLRQAAEEKQEWVRRSQNVPAVAANKYPRPMDSSKYGFEYFTGKATEAGSLAAKYNRMAAESSPRAN